MKITTRIPIMKFAQFPCRTFARKLTSTIKMENSL